MNITFYKRKLLSFKEELEKKYGVEMDPKNCSIPLAKNFSQGGVR